MKQIGYLLYPPQTVFVGGYTVFTLSVRPGKCKNETFPWSVRPTECVSVTFVSLISWRIIDGISQNFANTFICTRQILLIEN